MKAPLIWSHRALRKIEGHGVSEAEVECALLGPAYTRRVGRRQTVFAACGPRTLFIVLEDSDVAPGFASIVTARLPKPSEKGLLARRGKGIR